jgi:hypothetical protein
MLCHWGQADIKARTLPAAGDLDTLNAFADYFAFFGDVAKGPAGSGYYSTDIGEWHIALNSSIPMDVESDQYKWLKRDLALNTKSCTLAYWHFARYSSYGTTQVRNSVKPLWDALYAAGADVVLNSHLGTAIGVLKLTLELDKYSWEFIAIPGQTFTDSGSGSCHDRRGTDDDSGDDDG